MQRPDSADPRPFRFAMALLSVLILGTGFQRITLASPAPASVPGEILSNGALPFTETVLQMGARDAHARAQLQAAGGTAGPVVESVPLGDFPPKEPGSEDPDETFAATPARPGAVPDNPQTISTTFKAISLQDQFNAFGVGSFPPDTMGAVGPSHFVEVINSSVAMYTKAGALLSHVSLNSFFTIGAHPLNGSFDPRVLYDARSGHWFACALERGAVSGTANGIVLAVSRTTNPTGVWDKYFLDVGVATAGSTTSFTDYDTMGADDNGVYFGMRIFQSNPTTDYAKIVATPKASLIAASPSLGTVTQFTSISDMFSSPQPAHNQSAIAGTAAAWFVSSSTVTFGNVQYRTLTWSGGVPTLSATGTFTSPIYAAPINAPANGSATAINVGDDRLQMAVIRNARLWTCRNVGVNSSGTTSPAADRTGCEWFELNVTSTTPALVQRGRVFDNAVSDPRFYYYPSIMVNSAGDAAMGFSGSKSAEFAGAYTCGRFQGDALNTMQAVSQIQAGLASYQRLDGQSRNRWGDYSYTSLDPADDLSFWTIQEYAESPTASGDIWGTVVAKLTGPPTYILTASPPSVPVGGSLSVTWAEPPGSGAYFDWIGLFKVGDPNTGEIWWMYTMGVESGTSNNVPAPYTTGNYEFRFFLNNSRTPVKTSNAVTVTSPPPGTYTLTPSPTTVAAGGPLSISWTAPVGSPMFDWIGLFRVGDPNTGEVWYSYTGGAPSGTFNLSAPITPGSYEFRYFLNNTRTSVATSATVTVTPPDPASYSLTPSPTTVAAGGALSISWTAPPGSTFFDWIGLFKVGDPNTGEVWWMYTNGATSGTFNLTAPTTPGQYEFRYFPNNTRSDVKRSVAVTVN